MGRIVKSKKNSLCMLFLVLVMVLTGCGGQSANAGSSDTQSQTAQSTTASAKKESTTKKNQEVKDTDIPDELLPSDKDSSKETSKSGSADTTSSASLGAVYDAGESNSSSSTGSTASGSNGSSSSGNSNTSSTGNSSNQGTIQVTMSIDGSAANSYGYGVSMGAVAITLNAGASVYDALVASGVSFSGSAGYVSGIGGLFEKDCTAQSGWVYYVNGAAGTTGCGNYKCSDGDSIVWSYVLSSQY